MINETKYMRQQITNLIQIIDTIKYNTFNDRLEHSNAYL